MESKTTWHEERIEDWNKFAERLKRLTELAALRNVPLRKLIKQLGLKPVPHE